MKIQERRLTSLRVAPVRIPVEGPDDRANVMIHTPFFLAGILTVLTAGCLLGAVALVGVALEGAYTSSVWTPYILAHANSQLFGWVGFFVMGFAMQQHAPSVSRAVAFHRLAIFALAAMGLGIAVRFVAEPLSRIDPEVWIPVGIATCGLQLAAVLAFFYNVGVNRHRTGERLTWQALFVFASLGWLLLVSLAEPVVFARTHGVAPEASVDFIARWFGPLRESQFLGFVTMMIFGVALVKFHTCFGMKKAAPRWGLAGWILWMGGLVARIVGWVQYYDSGMSPSSVGLMRLGSLLLAAGAVCVVVSLGVFGRFAESYRSHKFIRAAFVWLLVAAGLLCLEPIHLATIGEPFSHAFTGAIRHALTVGFISQMIIGVGLHVVARMRALDDGILPPLWGVFWLLNLGNFGRVTLEIATDFTPRAFGPMGATGFVELLAILLWARAMVSLLAPRLRKFRPTATTSA